MNKVILEFTLKGRKHTYYRRKNIFGEAVTTTNKNSAKKMEESKVPEIIKLLERQFGKENINEFGVTT